VAGGSLPESCPKNGDLTEVSASINWQRWCHRLAQFQKLILACIAGAVGIRKATRAPLVACVPKRFSQRRIAMNNENLTIHFKVKDFNTWQTSYNGNEKNRTSAGITKSKVFRSTEDPNDVLLLQDVADVSKARTWYSSSEMKSVMEKSGVVGSPSIRVAA
jgi:hypothetical protein